MTLNKLVPCKQAELKVKMHQEASSRTRLRAVKGPIDLFRMAVAVAHHAKSTLNAFRQSANHLILSQSEPASRTRCVNELSSLILSPDTI